jgi:diguanylate cyclase (GGDEF)-like protein
MPMDRSASVLGPITRHTPMGSFKLRLVTYFLLLSLLPLLAAAWAFNEVAERSERGSADSRLLTALRVAQVDFAEETAAAGRDATSLSKASQVQQAFRERDRSAFVRIAGEVPHASFYSHGVLLAGEGRPTYGSTRRADVWAPSGALLGWVTVSVPLDEELLGSLRRAAGLKEADRFAIASAGKVVAPGSLRDSIALPVQHARYVELAGKSYRAVGTGLLAGERPAALIGVTPKEDIDAAVSSLRQRFILFALLALAAVGVLAYALGRTIVHSLKQLADAAGAIARGHFERRVPTRGRDEFARVGHAFNDMAAQLELRLEELAAERGRAREATARLGEALAATHDQYALLPVIVTSTVEATGAAAGRLVLNGEEIATAGDLQAAGAPLAIPLATEGAGEAVLYLTPEGPDFSDDARELAHWLGTQASIALENARLHRLVERRASTDGLTELANRRHFEEALAAEITRAERFGGTLALVLADLDDFKQVNDRHGHQAGDDVLRTFARILRETVREIDLPARFGGEEFALLLPQTDAEGAEQLAERLRQALAGRPMTTHSGALIAVTASFGVAAYPDSATPAALFAAADDALYRAKRSGKNCVVSADAGTTVRVGN